MAILVTAQATPNTTETALSFSGFGQSAFTTVPAGKTLLLLATRIANTDSSDHHGFVSRVPASGSAGAGNRLTPGSVVPALDAISDTDPHVLTPGQSLSVKADSALVTFTVSGALI